MARLCPRCGKGKLKKKKGYVYCEECTYEEYDREGDD